jgi:uncharacterized membrane protein
MKKKAFLSCGFYCISFLLFGCSSQAPEHTIVKPLGMEVTFPLAEVDDGEVHFYTYKKNGKNINFFVRTDGKGHLQAHFDACYSCYKYKMGYRVEGDEVVCIACNIGYRLADEVWDYVGACAPINLRSRVKGEFLVIKKSDIEKGERLF